MGIKELQKPRDVWCNHCDKGRGCGIYETKPEECNTFACLWKTTQSMRDNLRPDRSKCVMVPDPSGSFPVVHVDSSYPQAWRRDEMLRFLASLLDQQDGLRIVIVCGTKVTILKRTGDNEVTEFAAVYPEFAGKTDGEVQVTYDKNTPATKHRFDQWLGRRPTRGIPMQHPQPILGFPSRNPLQI